MAPSYRRVPVTADAAPNEGRGSRSISERLADKIYSRECRMRNDVTIKPIKWVVVVWNEFGFLLLENLDSLFSFRLCSLQHLSG